LLLFNRFLLILYAWLLLFLLGMPFCYRFSFISCFRWLLLLFTCLSLTLFVIWWWRWMAYLVIVQHNLVYWLGYYKTCQTRNFCQSGISAWVSSLSILYLIRFFMLYTLHRHIIFIINPLAMSGIPMSSWS
jgi:hypothetical protein